MQGVDSKNVEGDAPIDDGMNGTRASKGDGQKDARLAKYESGASAPYTGLVQSHKLPLSNNDVKLGDACRYASVCVVKALNR